MATDFSQIDLNDDQRHLLATAADQLGIPWAEVLERAISPFAACDRRTADANGHAESPYAILSRHGLIGCIHGTPSDLSTNKKYMTGYGKNG
jgi:hypothetical protein